LIWVAAARSRFVAHGLDVGDQVVVWVLK
jgi:hypothetical protein